MKFPVGCRRLLPVLCIFCLLFSGCGGSAEPGEKHLHTLDGKDFTAVCDVRLTSGGVESAYTLMLRHSGEQSEIAVQAPKIHAGITVRVDTDAELIWEDVQLVIPGGEAHISLFSLLHSLAESLTGGTAEAYLRERREGEDVITALCPAKIGEDALSHSISVTAKDGIPIESHSSAADGTTLYCRWMEFTLQEG